MAERNRFEEFDAAIEAMLWNAPQTRSGDVELEEFVRIARYLRDAPRLAFRARLKQELIAAANEAAKKEQEMSTAVKPIREGFHTLTPYVVVKGANEFSDFMTRAFGAEEKFRVPTEGGALMHAEARIGDSMIEFSDGNEQYPPAPQAIHLYVPDADAVYARAVEAGAVSLNAMTDQDYGDREGAVRDPFGNQWYIATHKQGDSYVPRGLRSITPYLHAEGAGRLIEFVKQAFGAQELMRHAAPDGAILHAELQIGDSVLELGEAHGQWQAMRATLHLYVEDTDALFRQAVAAGARPTQEPKDMPYGDRAAGVVDPFGNSWFIATHIRDVQF